MQQQLEWQTENRLIYAVKRYNTSVCLTLGKLLVDLQLVCEETDGFEHLVVENFKQEHSQLPHRCGSSSIFLESVKLWWDVITGT